MSELRGKSSRKPRLLDLFCKAGGAGKGYADAGFEVVGVDIEPQPRYPFEFVQGDALAVLDDREVLADFDAIHASPPCQAHVKGLGAVNAGLGRPSRHEDLIPATRERLIAAGLPYAIENVEGAPLINAVKLCGSSFRLPIRRHRLFECNFPVLVPPCDHSWQHVPRYWSSFAHKGRGRFSSTVVQVYGNGSGHEHWPAAMGIDWMRTSELTQAIPPAYTELIGGYMLAEVRARLLAAA